MVVLYKEVVMVVEENTGLEVVDNGPEVVVMSRYKLAVEAVNEEVEVASVVEAVVVVNYNSRESVVGDRKGAVEVGESLEAEVEVSGHKADKVKE